MKARSQRRAGAWRWLAASALALAMAPAVLAQQAGPSGWQFELVPYAWIPGAYGPIDVKGRSLTASSGPGAVLSLLFDGDAFAIGTYAGARYDRWFGYTDVYGGFLRDTVSETVPTRFCNLKLDTKASLYPVIWDVALGYEVLQRAVPDRIRPLTVGLYAGFRYTHFGVSVDAQGGVSGGAGRAGAVSEGFNWADPLIGVRWEVPLLERLSLAFRGDIGGFHASSNLIWGIASDVRYWPDWQPWSTQPWLGAGYRVVAFDHEFKDPNAVDLQLRGPLVTLGFVF